MARLEPRTGRPPSPTRVIIDIRPMQEPERTPITADYLASLLQAFAADPLAGESFVVLSRALRADPTHQLAERGLPVADRRTLPATSRVFRSAGLTLDSFLLRAAEIGTAAGSTAGSTARRPTVFHTAGGAVPLASRVPVVATLLDLAPWELPDRYAAGVAARFGHRLRARILHDAARVIVCSAATAESARRRLHLPRERIAVVPLAVEDAFRSAGRDRDRQAELRQRLRLPPRYLVFSGHYDARKDTPTLFAALHHLGTPADPPRLVWAGPFDSAEDRATVAAAVDRSGARRFVHVAPMLSAPDRAAILGGAIALVYPALSEATGQAVLEAHSLGVPVIASRAGALPELVGSAGIVVEPRDARRLAAALSALW
ncbi:MAG: glycosyltransferase, partial [Chloroflexota bacterium]|nr:glycosyltransferase [Chloroflexota bacterium]